MAGNFSAQVDAWVLKTKQRQEAVFKTAAQNVISDIIDRTPVDTGYLRASLTVTINQPTFRKGDRGDGYQAPPIDLSIAPAKVGDSIWAVFVANYAVPVEYGRNGGAGAGMVRLAAQAWPQHVANAVAAAKARVGR